MRVVPHVDAALAPGTALQVLPADRESVTPDPLPEAPPSESALVELPDELPLDDPAVPGETGTTAPSGSVIVPASVTEDVEPELLADARPKNSAMWREAQIPLSKP